MRQGDHYIVNGQKTWTTLAQYADWIFCLCRTDPAAKKQLGISFILIDMKTPGITVRPIQTMDGGREVNEVFFDDVKVPVENLVGQEHRGWDCAKFLLGNERTGIARVGYSKQRVQRIKELASRVKAGDKPLIEDERFREKVAAVEVELKALEMTQMRVLSEDRQRKDRLPNPKSSILKIKGSEIQQATTAAAAGDRRPARRCPIRRRPTIPSSAPTSRPWISNGPRRRRRPISTTARPRSTAAPTRSSATSSPRPCWAFDLIATPGLVLSLSKDAPEPRPVVRQADHGAPRKCHVMDFDLNDEQRQLKDSVERLLADTYGDLNKRMGYMKEPKGYSAALWKQYADLGLLGVPFAEEHGGLGPGPDRDHDHRRGVRAGARHRALSSPPSC